ncbi:uncharacterized protein LOC124197547 [Daphnia pulex]|uniref:uncharacterized protein LOC124197547 n=1 Tax=Daphnia pulex TaxID=6669 RepID=UPI001EDF9F4E|nr:uncharacterized protein LOC124197547 [Daphnia pulex]
MRCEIVCLLLLAVISSVYATSPVDGGEPQRFLYVGTTTVTSTVSTSTTCTTSTAALTTCTIGRRRRGLFYDEAQSSGRNRRGLFYNDEEVHNGQTAFLPIEKKASSNDPVAEVVQVLPKSSGTAVPLVIESGFSAPEGGPDRFLLQLAVSTVTSYTTTTTTTSLTAFCSSTTGWPLCGNFGK